MHAHMKITVTFVSSNLQSSPSLWLKSAKTVSHNSITSSLFLAFRSLSCRIWIWASTTDRNSRYDFVYNIYNLHLPCRSDIWIKSDNLHLTVITCTLPFYMDEENWEKWLSPCYQCLPWLQRWADIINLHFQPLEVVSCNSNPHKEVL